MIVILSYFYFGQDQYLIGESAVINAINNMTDWLLKQGYRNVLVDVNNECNIRYDHEILQPERVHELIPNTLDFGRFLRGKMAHLFITKPRCSYGYTYVCFFDLNHFP